MESRILLLLAALAGPVAGARADLITGQVVDSTGVGVAGVDIDVKSLAGGGSPPIFNDGTDVNGFFATTVPAGFYRVTFKPPPPPATTHLILEVEDVTVLGTTSMGVLTLPPGVALGGRVVDPSGLPVAGVNLDVIDLASGNNLTLTGGRTDAFGQFAIAVPAADIEVRFDATGVIGQTLASLSMDLSPTADTALGDVALLRGFHLLGTVLRPGGAPVVDADLDVLDATDGGKLYTPKDNTDVAGSFSVVVPAGTFDVEICPMPGDLLVGHTVPALVVSGDTLMGVISLQGGVFLTGTVRSFAGVGVPGADVNVEDSVTGAEVTLCRDNADSTGAYSVLVPTGTFDVKFTPPGFGLPLGSQTAFGVSVSAATALDGVLPPCPSATNYGAGGAGSGGVVPHLASSGGAPRVGNPAWTFELQDGVGGAPAVLIVGFGSGSFPLMGGTLLIDVFQPVLTFTVFLSGPPGVPGAGAASFPLTVKDLFAGATIFAQFAVIDLGSPTGVVFSDGLTVTFCP